MLAITQFKCVNTIFILNLVGMYRWKKVHRFVKESPYSGDTYFQLEKADNPISGQYQFSFMIQMLYRGPNTIWW